MYNVLIKKIYSLILLKAFNSLLVTKHTFLKTVCEHLKKVLLKQLVINYEKKQTLKFKKALNFL